MSAAGEEAKNLNEEERNPVATVSEGIPGSSSKDISGSSGLKKIENSPVTSKADIMEDVEEIEALIERKLPSDKEKGLDVDSELDFELKWDDDNDLIDNQKDFDATDAESKGLESDLASIEKNKPEKETESLTEKDIDSVAKESDSAFISIEKDLDKDTDSDFPSIEKDLDSLDQESDNALTSEQTSGDLDKDSDLISTENNSDNAEKQTKSGKDLKIVAKEIDTPIIATDKDLDSLEKEIENTCIDKDSGDADKVDSAMDSIEQELDEEIQQALTSMGEGNTLDTINSKSADMDKDTDLNAMDVDNVDEEHTKTALNDPDIIQKQSDEHLLMTVENDKTLNVDTQIQTDLKSSQNESESNSLDEELVYSDAEISNIEDKDLIEEIEAEITATEINDDKLQCTDAVAPNIEEKRVIDEVDAKITTEINDDKVEGSTQVSSELSTIEKKTEESKANEKEGNNMDVDYSLTDSIKESEKSDPNNTHSSITDHESSTYDINNEHELDRPDVMIDIPTQELIETFDDCEETFEIADDVINKLDESAKEIADKPDPVHTTTAQIQAIEDKASSDKLNEDNNAFDKLVTNEAEKTVLTEKSVETAEKESMEVDSHDTLTEVDKAENEHSSEVKSGPISKHDKDIDSILEEKVSHADITLEATTEANDKETLNEEVAAGELEPEVNKEIKTSNLENKEVEDIQKASDVPSTSTQEKVESSDSLKLKDIVDEPESSTTKEDKEAQSSDTAKPKEVEANTNEAQPSTSNHSELSDEDQETSDSLGLLAESSRVMDDDDEQEQEAEADDDDDDDEFDQDDESNQMTAEHSEDSNAHHSEADTPKPMDVDASNDAPESIIDMAEPDDAGDYSHSEQDDEKESNDEKESDEKADDEKVESNDEKDESSDELDQIQIGEVVSHTVAEEVVKSLETAEDIEETAKAVETLLDDKKEEESSDTPVEAVSAEEKDAVKPTEADSAASSKLRQLLLKDGESSAETPETEKKSPSKTKKLEISKPKNEINIVELEESSSEDDIQVVNKPETPSEVTSVNIPSAVEVLVTGSSSEVEQKGGELHISGLPKPAPQKPARLNTDEVTIKTTPATTEPLVIPEAKPPKSSDGKASIDFGLEIFSLDSDDEETEVRSKRKSKLTAVELDKARQTNKCINTQCISDGSVPLVPATTAAAVYYAANQQRGGGLCLVCAKTFEERSEKLVEGVKDLTPFLSMDMCIIREEFVEISDSDSEDEPDVVKDDAEIIGEKGAKFLEEQLADAFNDVWKKFNMEERLLSAQAEINIEVGQLEEECKQIDAMLNECQKETDKLRNDLYTAFADDRRELPAITICDTPTNQWSGLEEALSELIPPAPETRELPPRQKRRAGTAPAAEPGAKRPAIPLGYQPLDGPSKPEPKPGPSAEVAANDDDNADISVVKLSVEAAPAGLPPPGTATRPPLRPNMMVYAMRNTFGAWHKVKIVEVQPKIANQFTTCRVRFEQPKTMTKLLPARCLAYADPPDVRLTIGTRVIALFKDHRASNGDKKEEGEKKEAYYSGIVAEIPNPVNSFRYLIFFDDGYAQYVQHSVTRLVCECAPRVWDEVHPFSRQFVRDYLRAYPERPMVRLHAGQSIKTEWDGKWWVSKVLQVDASLVLVYFEGKKDNKTEWIYRGSTRLAPLYLELQAAERTRARPLPRAQAARRYNMPYVEYTRSDEPAEKSAPTPAPQPTQAQIEQEIRRQRAVAKKSTAPAPAPAPAPPVPAAVPRDSVTSRVVFYTPKNAIRPHKMVPHTCGPRCKRTDVLALKDLRTYNPLTKPLLSGWERQLVKYRIPAVKAIMYRAPCGRRIRDYKELHQYLQAVDSDMGVDLFDFNPATHCLAEFLLNKCLISKKDLSHGKENVPVPCVNYYDSSLPEFCSYNTERTPTAGVPLNLDPEFLCGCDCTDDCADKSKCACWKMTLEGARTIGLDTSEVGYVYKRLPEPLPSGIYECNSRCKCKQTCLNRVAQHPLQLKLQVFKTANRGWGIRALNDVPKGAFLCVYAGNLLTDATANLDGLNEGDEYLAELDYIEVVEQMKEGFEEDIPDDAKKLDEEEGSSSSMSSSEEEREHKDADDDDFRPAMPAGHYRPEEYSKRLRKREKSKKEKEEKEKKEREDKQKEKDGEDCITISDDEELREPAHFSVQTGMKGKEFVSKYKSVRAHFGKDEACYIMDAKVQGNIGRYLNHSCTPNVFVQNVFVDTHDPRFPWVAFFALSQIRAGTELTWNYNYDVGSVPGKVLYCYCNAPNCRGRLL